MAVQNRTSNTTPDTAAVDADRNSRIFNAPYVVRTYHRDAVVNGGFLDAGERAALLSAAAATRNRPILDVGVGTGRTTGLLQLLSDDYLAVDYAPDMVSAFAVHHPDTRCECRDARDLSAYADGSFGLIVFSNNAIDAVSHDDRRVILREFRRLLAPGGRIIFSTLNKQGPTHGEHPLQLHRPTRPLRPDIRARVQAVGRRVLDPASLVRAITGWRRNHRRSEEHQNWALGPLAAHDYQLMVHFTTLADLYELADDVGLHFLNVYSENAEPLTCDNDARGVDSFTVVAAQRP